MGLGDIAPEDNGGSDSEYKRITREEFQDFLSEHYLWERVYTEDDPSLKFTKELVYVIKEIDYDTLQLRVYSTIDIRTGKARNKGEDAIRTVMFDTEKGKPVGGRTRTHRIQTWEKNLKKKIDSLVEDWEHILVKCDECGDWMVKRDGEYGEFYGCMSYPECQNTKQIEQVDD